MTTLTTDDLISEITDEVSGLPYAQRMAVVRAYEHILEKHEDEAAKLRYAWPLHARESQLPPDGDWDTWMILAGRGFGKTRTGAEWIRSQVEDKKARRIALVARTTDEAQSVMIEGESGIINVSPHWNIPTYEPSKRKLTWPNGAFALRLGRRPRSVVTTTPKTIELVRSLPNRPGVHVTRGSTYENQDNLPPAFFNGLIDQYDGTRIGQQEIYAEITDEDEDALWKREWIEKARLGSHPPISRIVVSIDPAMSTRPTSSETGIVVVGADMRRQHAYILADESGRLTPNNMALRVAHLFDKFNATQIVVEANAGGNHVETTLRNAIERTLPIKSIRARHGKQIRAEPVAALYEQGRVHHVGRFPDLEDQMCTWTPDLGPSHSPDRADALVHAVTDLILNRNPINFW